MHQVRTGLGLIGAIIPIAYCGGMIWYFVDMGGWDDPFISKGLQPTILGLGIVGLIFVVLLGFQIRRVARTTGSGGDDDGPSSPAFGADHPMPPPRRSDGAAPPKRRDNGPALASLRDDGPPTDAEADAMIARYLAQRDAAPAASAPVARSLQGKTSFGRRGL